MSTPAPDPARGLEPRRDKQRQGELDLDVGGGSDGLDYPPPLATSADQRKAAPPAMRTVADASSPKSPAF